MDITKTFLIVLFFLIQSELKAALREFPYKIPLANVIHCPNPNGLFFVATLDGRIFRVENDKVTPFLDISSKVMTGSERGLLGFALHSDFFNKSSAHFGKFYLHYSSADVKASGEADHLAIVSEWTSKDGIVANSNSERILLSVAQPQDNHNGGDLLFHPQEKLLYISLGDGGSAHDIGKGHTANTGNAQDLQNLLGKILRIDPTTSSKEKPYSIPRDNPFKDNSAKGHEEIYAWGIRNAYRINLDQGKIIAGDVGQHRWEEVNLVERGKNYGWPYLEGFVPAERLKAPKNFQSEKPWFAYPNPRQGRSVIVGNYYQGKKYEKFKNKFIFGDFYIDYLYIFENGQVKPQNELKVGAQLSDISRSESGSLCVSTLEGRIFFLD